MSMDCWGCGYDGFIMLGDKKVSYCKYFRETKQEMDRTNHPSYYPFQHGYCSQKPKRPKTTETMMVDGEPIEIDPLSYEVGYTHGQFSERPKGEWKYGNGNGECPFCGRERQRGWDNYCGYCGARMRK